MADGLQCLGDGTSLNIRESLKIKCLAEYREKWLKIVDYLEKSWIVVDCNLMVNLKHYISKLHVHTHFLFKVLCPFNNFCGGTLFSPESRVLRGGKRKGRRSFKYVQHGLINMLWTL